MLPIILLSACTTTVPVQVPVEVPGPTRYIEIPTQLLTCEDTGPPPAKGAPLGDLFAWAQRTRAASVECQGRLGEVRSLTVPDSVRR